MKRGKVKVYLILFHADVLMCFHSVMVVNKPTVNRHRYALITLMVSDLKNGCRLSLLMISLVSVIRLMNSVSIDRP